MCRRLVFSISFIFILGLFLTNGARAELMGWWRLDEGSGNIAYDSSGNGRNGTLNGDPQWVTGWLGGALDFDGNDHVDTGYTDDLANWTITAWVKSPAAPSGDAPSGPVHKENNYQFNWNHGDATFRGAAALNVGGTWYAAKYEPLEADTWYHLAATYDGENLKGYRDGVLITDNSSPSGNPTSDSNTLKLARHASAAQFFTGIVDDARVYNEALTAEDIQVLMFGTGIPKAISPVPANGALHADTWVTMSWRAGDFAVSHDVYMGENFDDVNDGTGDTFRGNQATAYFVAGFPGFPYPEGLVPGTTYYWRVDEVNDADPNSPWRGDVWSFWVPPKKAYDAIPADGTMFVPTDVKLTWTPGFGAKLHTVYFGDDYETVSNATGGPPLGLVGYNPGPLEMNKTYYWRVDEMDGLNTYTGDVMSFTTTIEGLGEVVMERWENIAGTDIPALTGSWKYPNNPDVTERLKSFSWDQDIDNYGGRIHGWVYAPGTGNYTFWLCTDDNGELWLSTDDDSTNVRLIAQESNWSNPNTWGTGEQQSDPIPLVAGQKYYIMALWKEGGGGDHCQVAWQGPGVPNRVIIPGSNLSPYEPLNAFGAKPANNAADATQTPILQWKAGLQAASHELYFGTDEEAVRNATKGSPEYKGVKALGDESYNPGKLAWETTYYWRVDEVNATNPDSPWVGNVWNFTTADFIIIDDFEDYDAGDNQIWYSWHDGLGYGAPGTPDYFPGNGTGAAVGDETTESYTEETIVHGGSQAMPVSYDNNKQGFAKFSETEKTLTVARDWTEEGVVNLSLWFRGYPASTGSFVEGPTGTYTMTGSGADIWAVSGVEADEFHFAYKTLTGPGSIVARVQSMDNTNAWAKAGVMIRETLNPDSAHAMMIVSATSGVSFQRRPGTGATSVADTTTGIAAPYWVKIERDLSGNFRAYSSTNGTSWVILGEPEPISMGSNVYIGLAVTSHDAALTCQAVFSNVTITGTAGPMWSNQDVGIASNDAEPLYVAVSNSSGAPAVVTHDNPDALTTDVWTEWIIPLQAFADQGINLTNVDRIAIGLGTQGNMTVPGGSGTLFIDDIRLYRPAPEPEPQP